MKKKIFEVIEEGNLSRSEMSQIVGGGCPTGNVYQTACYNLYLYCEKDYLYMDSCGEAAHRVSCDKKGFVNACPGYTCTSTYNPPTELIRKLM